MNPATCRTLPPAMHVSSRHRINERSFEQTVKLDGTSNTLADENWGLAYLTFGLNSVEFGLSESFAPATCR